MPRDSGGNYTLPAGNPVVTGTIIESVWANDTMEDIAVQMNNVITRDGLLGPIQPFLVVDGTEALPGMAFGLSPRTGLYRFSPNVVGMSVGGDVQQIWKPDGIEVTGDAAFGGDLGVVGDATVGGDLTVTGIIINGGGGTGQFLAADGTAALPAYSFTSEPDMGMYRAGVDRLAFSTVGIGRVQIDNQGLVGINMVPATPGNFLDVNGSIRGIGGAAVGGAGWGIRLADSLNLSGATLTVPEGTGAPLQIVSITGAISFGAGSAVRQIITTGGEIGINCTPPANVTLRVQFPGASDVGLEWQRLGASSGELRSFDRTAPAWDTFVFGASDYIWMTTAVPRMTLDNAGLLTVTGGVSSQRNISVAWSNPGADVGFFVTNQSTAINSRAKVEISNGGTAAGSDALTHYVNQGTWDWSTGIHSSSSSYRIHAGPTLASSYFLISTTGNVGIGIGNALPGARLHIADPNDARILLDGTVAGAGNGGTLLYYRAGVYKARVGMQANTFGDNSDNLYIHSDAETRIYTGGGVGTEVVRVTNTGRVGIGGNISPGATLHVNAPVTGDAALFTDSVNYTVGVGYVGAGTAWLGGTGGTALHLRSGGALKLYLPTNADTIYVREGTTDFRVALGTESSAFGSGGTTFPIGGVLLGRGAGMGATNPFADVVLGGAVTITIFGISTNTVFNVGTYRLLGRETNATNVDTTFWMRVA